MKKVQLITDGACLGNPGPGGWAAVLRFNEQKKEMWASEKHTTNNRMELTAAIEGLKRAERRVRSRGGHRFRVREERNHAVDSRLERKGWLTAAKKPVVNQDLWQELDEQVKRHA